MFFLVSPAPRDPSHFLAPGPLPASPNPAAMLLFPDPSAVVTPSSDWLLLAELHFFRAHVFS